MVTEARPAEYIDLKIGTEEDILAGCAMLAGSAHRMNKGVPSKA